MNTNLLNNKKMNCVIYCRVSTSEQAENGFSLDAQENFLKEYAYTNSFNVVDIYIDAGISAKDTNRPEFKRMCKDVFNKNNNIDCILVYKLSRLSRKTVDVLNFYEKINNFNKRLIVVKDSIDTNSSQGKLMLTMLSFVAEMERDNIIDQVKNAMKQKAKEGEWNSQAPYGYDIINKQLVINAQEAEVVKLIYDLYLNRNMGYKAIALHLNAINIPTKRNCKWSLCSVREKLINPVYMGYVYWNRHGKSKSKNKEIIKSKGKHTAIISEDIWYKTQQKISNTPGKFKRIHKGEFLLSGILRCPKCGGSMLGYRRLNPKNGQLYKYYQCNNARTKGAKVCSHNMVNSQYAENYVLNSISKIVNDTNLLNSIYSKVNNHTTSTLSEIQQALNIVENKLNTVDRKLSNLIEMKLNEEITSEEFAIYKNKLSIERETLYTKKGELNKNLINLKDTSLPLEFIKLTFTNFHSSLSKCSDSKKKLLIRALIDKITVNNGDCPQDRTIKKIFFHIEPAELKSAQYLLNDFPPTYDKVHHL